MAEETKGLEESLIELKDELLGKQKQLTQEEVKAAFTEFNDKFKDTLGEEAKSIFDANFKKFEESYTGEQKQIQDHLNKLDMRIQGNEKKSKTEQKTFNEVLAETLEEKTDELMKFQRKETNRLVLELKAVGDMTTGNVTGGSRYGQLFAPGIIERPGRRVHMTDILAGGSIGAGNSFTHMRESGVGEGNPAPTAEGATKPQFDYDLVENTVQVETVAGWLRVTRKAMQNIPGFISFLQNRIPDRFQRVLDSQILYGDGSTPNMKGILTAGNFVNVAAADKPVSQKLVETVSLLEDTYERVADTILMRPADIMNILLEKASGSGEHDLPFGFTIAPGGGLAFLGIPVIGTTALTAGDIVVGEFAQGAQVLTQNDMRIEFFEQDGDNVRTNKVTVRVEGDYALPVYGPDYFIKNTTATA